MGEVEKIKFEKRMSTTITKCLIGTWNDWMRKEWVQLSENDSLDGSHAKCEKWLLVQLRTWNAPFRQLSTKSAVQVDVKIL